MVKENLNNFIKGWFVGDFDPAIIKSNQFEVSVKRYNAGDYERTHFHKIATEITVIIEGEVEMNCVKYVKNDIVIIKPNELTDFKCLTDVVTVVVKTPSINNDKYIN